MISCRIGQIGGRKFLWKIFDYFVQRQNHGRETGQTFRCTLAVGGVLCRACTFTAWWASVAPIALRARSSWLPNRYTTSALPSLFCCFYSCYLLWLNVTLTTAIIPAHRFSHSHCSLVIQSFVILYRVYFVSTLYYDFTKIYPQSMYTEWIK